ncbi:hypothetical protein CK503_07895 [Aliifodinibius salipaludis]|uniref:TonB-dependent receptor plug domain-containing protein n=1 Tax=Fodinibius salipaludis TaxID=2032627 RepID=A0A2A2G8Q0_9BACT|nr:carboxypeptidase-like regulatory domain-containing protein [Aliifodinibius salipaludis]PAU94126.1 hypothetical protein CK503_07895 [Aliifodinibius salipaludis]
MTNRIRLLSFVCLLLLPFSLQAQDVEYTVTGTLIDQRTEDPLTGANVSIENTTIGTSADADGTFELTARVEPGTYNLRITFIGYRTVEREVEFGDEQEIALGTIALQQDVIGADEVVVTGASVLTEKRQLGNSISTVSADELASTGVTEIDAGLSGKIAGALVQQNSGDPAGGISVRLRGTGTLLGSASPLYIVDGVIVNNDSPELVDVGGTSTNRLADLNPEDIDRIEVVKGAAAAALYGSRANNGVVQIFTKQGKSGTPSITIKSTVNVDKVRKTLDVNMAQNENGDYLDNSGNVMSGKRYDFQDYIFRTAVGTNQFLSISGGANDTRYYISGSHKNNEGIVDGSNYQRSTARLNLDQVLTNWANLSTSLSYSHSNNQQIPNGGLNASYGALTGFIFGPNTVNPEPDPQTGEYPNNTNLANPLEVIDTYDFQNEVNRVIGSAKLSLTPHEGLSIDHTLGLDTYSQVGTAFIPPGTSAPGLSTGFGRRSERAFFQLNNDLRISYQTDIKPWLNSSTLFGGTLQYENVETIGLEAQQFSIGSRVVSGGANFEQPGEFRSETVIYGIFGQQTFGYKDRLFVTEAGDARLDFYLSPDNSQSTPNGLPIDKVEGFYTSASDPIPVYLPGEMNLIRAEAYVNLDRPGDAVNEIDNIRTKQPSQDAFGVGANLPAYSGGTSDTELFEEIYRQRSAEMYLTGMRFEDARRLGRPVPSSDPALSAERNRVYYPYPTSERQNNPNTPENPEI